LIDAALPLSVQVHPDDRHAQRSGLMCGKSEAWVVVHVEPGSKIYSGVNDGVDAVAFGDPTNEMRIEDVLFTFEPHEGDLVYLPAGTIHALGGGVTVFEIQQSSDVTYRLHDWGRVDPKTGKSRDLHLDDAMACMTLSGPVHPRRGERSLV